MNQSNPSSSAPDVDTCAHCGRRLILEHDRYRGVHYDCAKIQRESKLPSPPSPPSPLVEGGGTDLETLVEAMHDAGLEFARAKANAQHDIASQADRQHESQSRYDFDDAKHQLLTELARLREENAALKSDKTRVDLIEEYLVGLEWHWPRREDGSKTPVLRWFIGDGSDEFSTSGQTIRDAIDQADERLNPAEDLSQGTPADG